MLFSENDYKLLQKKFGIVGDSKLIREQIIRLLQAAPTDLNVLITGETGTGKEVFANAIHGLSKRNKYPLIKVNCAAIPETLLESELFGHEKGAYTGAIEQRKGFFEVADNGTIFLDEIGEMPLGTQVKLLRVLESGEFSRLGSTSVKKVNVRVIAATNRNLEQEIQSGLFRHDLFYRLKNVQLKLPSLRDHPEDIPLLADFFARRVCEKNNIEYQGISDDSFNTLKSLPFPGNIRELKNLIETVFTLERLEYLTNSMLRLYITPALPAYTYSEQPAEASIIPFKQYEEPHQFEMEIIFRALLEMKNDISEIKSAMKQLALNMHDLSVEFYQRQNSVDEPDFENSFTDSENFRLDLIEKQVIENALKYNLYNRKKTAKALGISLRTLYRKMSDYNLDEEK
ncbi:MAG TPA: sigma-54 dependent transcriptional regulator [Candidatus Kapabacteria bacterium]|nr:sigma-54 dependent transcriptional regulator [Candidatus Kapabacteria bacterium]HPO62784.1 sigma-54 dependent transcriptional regulator [Candidatus Kapabacteria bacterium]